MFSSVKPPFSINMDAKHFCHSLEEEFSVLRLYVSFFDFKVLCIIGYSFASLRWGIQSGMKELARGATEEMPSLPAIVKTLKKPLIYGRALSRYSERDSDKEVRMIPGWFSTGCGSFYPHNITGSSETLLPKVEAPI